MMAKSEENDFDDFISNIAADNGQEAQRDDKPFPVSSDNSKIVKWRGNFVPEKEAKALHHVFDNLQDHFGHQRPDPRVRFNTSLAHPGHGQFWSGDLEFTYNIDGDHCIIAYMSIDSCLDLTPKLVHKHGQPLLKGYGTSWVYVHLPEPTFERIKSYVSVGTGWNVSDEGAVYDPNRKLYAIKAKMHHAEGEPKPSFWVIKEKEGSNGGDKIVSFSRLGSVQEVAAQSHQQHVHRGVCIFSVSMEVEGTSNFKPHPGAGYEEADLSFTLVSARTWGITDCVAPIVHATSPSQWR